MAVEAPTLLPSLLPGPEAADAARVLTAAAACIERGLPAALATVLEKHGSAPGTPGQKLLFARGGPCLGTVGGGAVEHAVLAALVALTAPGAAAKAEVRSFKLGPELGMCCGGRLEVMLEPLVVRTPCLVIGGGHVATALAPLLPALGFAVTVTDPREGWGEPGRIPGVTLMQGDFDEAGREVSPAGVCIVMSHDHALDQAAIEWALTRGFAFVGGIGSRAKAERTRQRLEHKGFSAPDRERVRMPLGLDIGARLPAEIAIAVAAELVAWVKQRA